MNQSIFENDETELEISFYLNGSPVRVSIKPSDTAIETLRNKLGLKSVKEGCGIGECGACTIILDRKAVNACLILAAQLDGRSIHTTEGLAENGDLNYLQRAFLDKSAVQCGFCTPGMLMSAKVLLDNSNKPSRDMIKQAISGNLCRCGGYVQIVEAIEEAAATRLEHPSNEAVDK
ncbi:MAG: (2Fe-2S)-binding protein [Desulfomonilaceae bacterium]